MKRFFSREGGLVLLGLLAAVLTVVCGVTGFWLGTRSPSEPIELRVDSALDAQTVAGGALGDLNISQDTVDAAAEQFGLGGYAPLVIGFSAEPAPSDLTTTASPGLDVEVFLGEPALGEATGFPPSEAVVLSPDLAEALADPYAVRSGTIDGFENSVGSGHGPGAVVAAAHNASRLIHPAPNPLLFYAAAGISAGASFVLFWAWARRRRHRETDERTLASSRYRLARVVLDQQALEASLEAGEPTETARALWEQIGRDVVRLQSQEDDVVAVVRSSRLVPKNRHDSRRRLLTEFAQHTASLLTDATVLEQSLEIQQSGRTSAAHSLINPLHEAIVELNTRLMGVEQGLSQREALAVTQQTQVMNDADQALLHLTEREDPGRVSGEWLRAEADLMRAVTALTQLLRRRDGRVVMHLRDVRFHAELGLQERLAGHRDTAEARARLRATLGLPEEAPLQVLETANVVARARFGDHPALDASRRELPRQPITAEPMRAIAAPTQQQLKEEEQRATRRRATRVLLAGALVLLVGFAAGATAQTALEQQRPAWEQAGDERLSEVIIDGDTQGHEMLTEERIRAYLRDQFSEPVRLILAVRPAEEYLEYTSQRSDRLHVGYAPAIRTLGRIKQEVSATGELVPPQVILPVFILDDGTFTTLPALTGTLAVGEQTGLGELNYRLTDPPIWDFEHVSAVTTELESLSRQLNSNAVFVDRTNPQLAFWAVSLAVIALGCLVVQVLRWIGQLSAGLGRWGTQAPRLREAQQRIDRLFLTEDERDYALALDTGRPGVEAEHQLFDRLLIVCARELDDLRLAPRAERTDAGFARRIDRLLARLDSLHTRHR
ncbi:MAG: hypothetical protein ACTHZ5_13765 [Micrococcaceae bacterium]